MNDPLAERYYTLIKEKVKEDYYWEQKVKNFIKTGSYYEQINMEIIQRKLNK